MLNSLLHSPAMFKIVTWNVNSIAMRLERVLAFLERESPDVLCLQELKCEDSKFPFEAIQSAGWQAAVYGQKAYNGVALISKKPVRNVQRNFGKPDDDPAARFISGVCTAPGDTNLTVMSAYCPNGQSVGSEKYSYKLDWFSRLRRHLDENHQRSDAVVLVGDFNVAPEDRDVFDPVAWKEHIHCSTGERDALKKLLGFGFHDTFRLHHQDAGLFSWWDYRQLSFQQNKGLRIDMIYATRAAASKCVRARIDRDERKGEKPSDHAPVIAEFKFD